MKRLLLLTTMVVSTAFAAHQRIQLIGGREYALALPKEQTQIITLQSFHLDPDAALGFRSRLKAKPVRRTLVDDVAYIPRHYDLGMNHVPVLNQGAHGACVVFSVSAALDAINDGKDSISELCTLELGSYLHQQNQAYPSGWDGSVATTVLGQYRQYGAINKLDQHQNRCGGLADYPRYDPSEIGIPMSVSDYKARSHMLSAGMRYQAIMTLYDAVADNVDMEQKLSEVKQAIAKGHRVVIGFVLDPMLGTAGAIASNKVKEDTWLLNEDVKKSFENNCTEKMCHLDGHEVIVTAYHDDMQIAGHRGVLSLRNSWGEEAGYHGDFYMTYDYFKAFVMEATELE